MDALKNWNCGLCWPTQSGFAKFKRMFSKVCIMRCLNCCISHYKNSPGDEIANVNFFYDNIVHVEASAYAHCTTT